MLKAGKSWQRTVLRMERIERRWGYEEVVVNEPEYCYKRLHMRKGLRSSYHYHSVKKETLLPYKGDLLLNVKGTEFLLAEPVTINPMTPHCFTALTDAIFLEVSTHFQGDDDLVRLQEGKYD